MKSKDVQRITGLTRKAIEYYEMQGLLNPLRDENGYRNYRNEDVSRLTQINAYRKLGLSVAEIANVLSDNKKEAISNVVREKEIRHSLDDQRLYLLSQIASGIALEDVADDLRSLESRESIYNKISGKFPGYIGQMLFVNYAHFLQGRLETLEQMDAYDELILFLDQMEDPSFTEEELKMISEASESINLERIDSIVESKLQAVQDIDKWMRENQDVIEQYLELKNSKAYQAMPIVKLFEKMKDFLQASGYYETVIPLLRKMSPGYDEYYRQLIQANEYMTESLFMGYGQSYG